MRLKFLLRRAPFLAAAAFVSAPMAACAHRGDYYDSAYNDRHRWDSREDAAYRRWETERKVEHITFERRPAEDQRAYWTWRHAHPD